MVQNFCWSSFLCAWDQLNWFKKIVASPHVPVFPFMWIIFFVFWESYGSKDVLMYRWVSAFSARISVWKKYRYRNFSFDTIWHNSNILETNWFIRKLRPILLLNKHDCYCPWCWKTWHLAYVIGLGVYVSGAADNKAVHSRQGLCKLKMKKTGVQWSSCMPHFVFVPA